MEKDTKQKYIGTVGRRKTSVARVRIHEASKNSYTINDREIEDYFPTVYLQKTVTEALDNSEVGKNFRVTVKVLGGGISSQADAVRHGIARALVKYNADLRNVVKKRGYLKRDPRAKERRKFGLKKARKAPQWSKR